MVRVANRFDLACRVFKPPTKYDIAVERQRVRRHDRVVRLSHYKTGDPWTRR
jgi:hypothetical protein